MKENKQKVKGRGLWTALSIVFTGLFIFTMIAGPIANNYATIINMVLGIDATKTVGDPGQTYFEADFTSAQQVTEAEKVVESIVANGSVLLLNRENALPLAVGAKITLAGISSADFVYGGTGSGGMDTSKAQSL